MTCLPPVTTVISLHLTIRRGVCLRVSLFVCRSVCIFYFVSVSCLRICFSPSMSLCVQSSDRLTACLSVCLSVFVFVSVSPCLRVCLSLPHPPSLSTPFSIPLSVCFCLDLSLCLCQGQICENPDLCLNLYPFVIKYYLILLYSPSLSLCFFLFDTESRILHVYLHGITLAHIHLKTLCKVWRV